MTDIAPSILCMYSTVLSVTVYGLSATTDRCRRNQIFSKSSWDKAYYNCQGIMKVQGRLKIVAKFVPVRC